MEPIRQRLLLQTKRDELVVAVEKECIFLRDVFFKVKDFFIPIKAYMTAKRLKSIYDL